MKNNNDPTTYYSAGMTFCPVSGAVSNGSKQIHLTPVNMRVLVCLCNNHQQVVSRSTIFETVWGQQVVSDDALTRCISDLRTQLAPLSSAHPIIETLPKRGYRWSEPMNRSLEPLQLTENTITTKLLTPQEKQTPNQSVRKIIGSRPKWLSFSFYVIIFLLFASIISFILQSLMLQGNHRLAVLPIKNSDNQLNIVTENMNDILWEQLINTEDFKLLSKTVLETHQDNHFILDEYSTHWLIEGNMRKHEDKTRITLNLVDSKTFLVDYSQSADLNPSREETIQFCQQFIQQIHPIISPHTSNK